MTGWITGDMEGDTARHTQKIEWTCSGIGAGGDVISAYVWRLCLEGLCSRRRWVDWEHTRYMVIDAWEDDEKAS
jgi:hypothetical protein